MESLSGIGNINTRNRTPKKVPLIRTARNRIAAEDISGSGLFVQLQKHNLVYWNDPNELVCRLRLLIASKAAGNKGVSNEILSIFEELQEAGLMKRIPNV
ncbi:Uncharacterized protein FWK35_00031582, partial [Aphis craccivora]